MHASPHPDALLTWYKPGAHTGQYGAKWGQLPPTYDASMNSVLRGKPGNNLHKAEIDR